MDTSVQNFHANCLLNWNCYNCPVCYFIQNPDSKTDSVCMECEDTTSLWFCIICGHIGCSRTKEGHALAHYNETQHEYVMELENFEVWNYKSDKYVHILDDKDKRLDKFHTYECIKTETGCTCPVCSLMQTPKLVNQLMCMRCQDDIPGTLWICLYCSHVGCSRHHNGDALKHYTKTKHPFCMQLNNFSIWNYNEHKYLHRLWHENIDNSEITEAGTINKSEKPQRANLKKRMDRLEKEWKDFRKLSEANEKMRIIEQRLLSLTSEKKVLEEKLQEHDIKLNELLTQFVKNQETSSFVKSEIIVKQESSSLNFKQTEATEAQQADPNQILSKANEVSYDIEHSEFISIIILLLFLYHFVSLFLQNIAENIMSQM